MRNLKKILALVMALVMSLSLVTIANASDFDDAADITYEEAVDVMSTIGVIEGFEDGSFDPDGTLTREQAAKLVTYMLLGDNADRLGVESSTFNDVAVTRWSAPAIEYCVAMGIIDGAGDGNFYPAGQLTGYAFAKILLTALGYDSQKEGLTGTSWSVNVAALAMDVGLHKGLANGISSAPLTREEAAQMALNAIKAPLVTYDSSDTITVNGVPVTIGGSDATYVTTTLAREQRIGKDTLSNSNAYTVEFGERYFPELRLDEDVDAFGRPSYTWTYDTEDIGTYIDTDKLAAEYTAKVEGGDIYADIGSAACEYDLTYFINGVDQGKSYADTEAAKLARRNSKTVGTTGNGVLTQVYVDHDNEELTIVEIHTYLAKATADYNERTEQLMLEVYNGVIASDPPKADNSVYRAHLDNVDNLADFVEDDMVLVTIAGEDEVVMSVELADIITDVTANAYTSSSDKLSSITADGEKHNVAKEAYYEAEWLYDYYREQLDDYTYNLYMDEYGYIIGIEDVTSSTNYVFVVAYDPGANVLGETVDKALVIFPDGEMTTVSAKESKTQSALGNGTATHDAVVNTWCTYTVDDDNVYILTEVPTTGTGVRQGMENRDPSVAATETVDREHVTVGTAAAGSANAIAYGNNDSVYITVKADDTTVSGVDGTIVSVRGVTTGIKNTSIKVDDVGTGSSFTSLTNNVYYLYNGNYFVTYAVVVGNDAAVAQNFVYATSGVKQREYISGVGYVDTYDAIVDGEETQVQVIAPGDISSKMSADTLYQVDYNADGYVIAGGFTAAGVSGPTIDTATNADEGYVLVNNPTLNQRGATIWINSTTVNNQYVIMDEDVVFYVENEDGDYDRYTSITSAMNAATPVTGTPQEDDVIGVTKFVAICDGYTGYATSVIIDLVYQGETYVPSSYDGTATGTAAIENLTIKVYERTGETADTYTAARNLLVSEGWTITNEATYGVGEYQFTVTKGGLTRTYVTDTVTLAAVTVNNQYASSGVSTTPTTVYLAKGESITVTLNYAGTLSQNNLNTVNLGASPINAKIAGKSLSADGHTMTVVLEATADWTSASTITIQWT